MLVQQPPQSFDGYPVILVGFAPLLLANFVYSGIKGLDDVKSVQNKGSLRAPVFDSTNIRLAHIATGGSDLFTLIAAQLFNKEAIYGFTPLAHSNPEYT